MDTFAIISESTETTVTKKRLRSPGIHFSHSSTGEQYITVDLTEVIEVNGVITGEQQLDRVTINPMDLASVQLVSPTTGLPLETNGSPELISIPYVLTVLFTIFKTAATSKGYV